MSAVGGSNYVSDATLLAWVTTQQDRLYGDLKETMGFQQLQGEMSSELADIKQAVVAAQEDPKKYAALEEDMKAFVAKYGDIPEFGQIVDSVKTFQADVTHQLDKVRGSDAYGQKMAQYAAAVAEHLANGGNRNDADCPKPPEIEISRFAQATTDSWIKALDEKLDASSTNEQLGMIHLNELKSTIDQSSQQASQMLKSNNDSLNFIINNFV